MRPIPISAGFIAAASMLAACADRSPSSPADRLSFNFSNGPAEPGPIIVRSADGFGAVFINFVDNIVSIHSPNDGRRIEFTDCQTVTTMTPQDVQLLFAPSGAIHLLALSRENFVSVHDWSGQPDINCAFVTDATRLLATGRVPFVAYDNDITGFDGQGANSFGNQSHGRVSLVGGGSASYSLKREHLIFRDGTLRFNVVRIGPLLR